MLKKYLLILISVVLFSGCTISSKVYYKTETDPMISLNKQKTFRIFLPKNPEVEDKKFYISFKNKMIENGFSVTDDGNFDFAIFYQLTEKSYSGTSSYTSYVPTTSYSSGYVGNTYVYGSTTSTKPVEKSYTYTDTYKKIYVDILNPGNKNSDGSYETVWNGFMSSDVDDYYENPQNMINELVKLIGKDFKGDIYVVIKE